jgi:chloramphenicol-sensitive protein RarD
LWGFAPLFWRLLGAVPATELLAHRLSWACVLFCGWLAVRGRLGEVRAVFRTPGVRWRLVGAAVLVATNWFVFVYAVLVGRVLDVSLGYFINPLVSVALGRLVLGERLGRLQLAAVAVAAGGIAVVAIAAGGLPWISLVLAGSFGGYGLVRKTTRVAPLPGSAFETLLLLPFGLAFIAYLSAHGESHFLSGHGPATDVLMIGTGPVTAIPLLLFVNAARRLRLTTVGFLQYLAPSLQFVVAVGLFHEPTPAPRLAAFALVWLALAIFTYDAWRSARGGRVARS